MLILTFSASVKVYVSLEAGRVFFFLYPLIEALLEKDF